MIWHELTSDMSYPSSLRKSDMIEMSGFERDKRMHGINRSWKADVLRSHQCHTQRGSSLFGNLRLAAGNQRATKTLAGILCEQKSLPVRLYYKQFAVARRRSWKERIEAGKTYILVLRNRMQDIRARLSIIRAPTLNRRYHFHDLAGGDQGINAFNNYASFKMVRVFH